MNSNSVLNRPTPIAPTASAASISFSVPRLAAISMRRPSRVRGSTARYACRSAFPAAISRDLLAESPLGRRVGVERHLAGRAVERRHAGASQPLDIDVKAEHRRHAVGARDDRDVRCRTARRADQPAKALERSPGEVEGADFASEDHRTRRRVGERGVRLAQHRQRDFSRHRANVVAARALVWVVEALELRRESVSRFVGGGDRVAAGANRDPRSAGRIRRRP